jgi:Transposase DDE domain
MLGLTESQAVESDFAVDSSGFSTSRLVRWYSKKHGRVKDNREWVKVNLMCGVSTKTVTSVEVSGCTAHDTNYFVPLVERTAGNF